MPKSYPASCNFIVAKPPTYEESINNLYKHKKNNPKYKINNYTNNLQYNEGNINPKKNKKTLCNIQ